MGHMGFLSIIHLWILVRKGMFMDEKFGHNYLGLFGNILRGKGSSHVEAIDWLLYDGGFSWEVFLTYLSFCYFITAIIKASWGRCRGVQFR